MFSVDKPPAYFMDAFLGENEESNTLKELKFIEDIESCDGFLDQDEPSSFFKELVQKLNLGEEDIPGSDIIENLTPWDSCKYVVAKHESEWAAKSDEKPFLDKLVEQYGNPEFKSLIEHEKSRIDNLIWMPDVESGLGLTKEVWNWWPVNLEQISSSWIFPLKFRPAESYKVSPRSFGSGRSNGRKHAGCDLYAEPGTEILAMKRGKIKDIYSFYLGTNAIEVDHGDFTIRYGEISAVRSGLSIGDTVEGGEVIAQVGTLKFPSGTVMSMLHIEFYNNKDSGPLTVRDNLPFKRRKDLVDPTPYLDNAIIR